MGVPDARLEFDRQNFENFSQGDLDAFAGAVLARPLGSAVLILVSTGLKSRGCLISRCSASSILAIWDRSGRGRNGWSGRGRLVSHFGGRFLDARRWVSRLPQKVLQKAKHVSPNQVRMDARRSFSVLAPGKNCLFGSASPEHAIYCLFAGQLFQRSIRMNHATKSRAL